MKKIGILTVVVAALFAGVVDAQDSEEATPLGEKETAIACSLSQQDLATRKEDLTPLKEAVLQRKEIEKGIELTFPPEHFGLVTQFIETENGCCSFFEFTLTVGPGNKPLRLSITGPPAAKECRPED